MFRPIQDFVVIARDDTEKTTDGGIIIPDTAQQKVTRGVVLAVGRGAGQPSVLADRLEGALEGGSFLSDKGHLLAVACRDVIAALRRKAPELKAGEHVLFGKYTGNEAKVKDDDGVERECIITRDAEVYGVIEDA